MTTIVVADNAALNAVLYGALQPGDRVEISPGTYTGYHSINGKHGTATQPITITAADPDNPPVFSTSATCGLQAIGCSYLSVKHIAFDYNRDIGLFFQHATPRPFDTLSDCHHVEVSDCTFTRTGQGDWGNHDGIKLTGVDHFAVRRCTIDGWGDGGGSGVDVVGSQYGLIDGCSLRNPQQAPSGTATGITIKGGSRSVEVSGCLLYAAGKPGIQIGQDTGIQYFRSPPGSTLSDGTVVDYEAKEIEVWNNTILDNKCGIYWGKSSGGRAHHNTIVQSNTSSTERSPFQISALAVAPLLQSHHGRMDHNLIVYRWKKLYWWAVPFVRRTVADANTLTFTFDSNAWYQTDIATEGQHWPNVVGALGLPTADGNAIYQIDPQLSGIDANGLPTGDPVRITSLDPALADIGAHYEETPDMTLLTGCSDPDGDAITAELVTQATNGVAVVNPDGTGSYTPNAGFAGVDTFAYRVSDGSAFSSPATVTVTVLNQAPTAADHTYSTPKNTPVTL